MRLLCRRRPPAPLRATAYRRAVNAAHALLCTGACSLCSRAAGGRRKPSTNRVLILFYWPAACSRDPANACSQPTCATVNDPEGIRCRCRVGFTWNYSTPHGKLFVGVSCFGLNHIHVVRIAVNLPAAATCTGRSRLRYRRAGPLAPTPAAWDACMSVRTAIHVLTATKCGAEQVSAARCANTGAVFHTHGTCSACFISA